MDPSDWSVPALMRVRVYVIVRWCRTRQAILCIHIELQEANNKQLTGVVSCYFAPLERTSGALGSFLDDGFHDAAVLGYGDVDRFGHDDDV